jgi:hypothetical protein
MVHFRRFAPPAVAMAMAILMIRLIIIMKLESGTGDSE